MNLKDLSGDEKLALVALTEVAVVANRTVTEEELAQVDEVVDALGEDEFHRLADEAEARFADRDHLKTFLLGISNQEARELIYGTALTEALAEGMPHEEAGLLEWLAAAWQIPVDIGEAEEEGGEEE
jgi:hypothetical protein